MRGRTRRAGTRAQVGRIVRRGGRRMLVVPSFSRAGGKMLVRAGPGRRQPSRPSLFGVRGRTRRAGGAQVARQAGGRSNTRAA